MAGADRSLARLIRASSRAGAEVPNEDLERVLYRAIIEQVPGVIYIEVFDDTQPNEFKDLYVSPQIESWLGYSPEEWSADYACWNKAVHPDDWDRVIAENERTYRTGDPYGMEYRMLKASGEVVWVHDEAVLVRDEVGSPLYWQGLMLDSQTHRGPFPGYNRHCARIRLWGPSWTTFIR